MIQRFLLTLIIVLLTTTYITQSAEAEPPTSDRCPNAGPLTDGSECGCVVGFVYIDGAKAEGVSVTLTDGTQSSTTTTDAEGFLFTGDLLNNQFGLSYGDPITLTVNHGGEDYAYAFAAVADGGTGVQEVSFPIPDGTATTPQAEIGSVRVTSEERELEVLFDGVATSNDIVGARWLSEDGKLLSTSLDGRIRHDAMEPYLADVTLEVVDRFGNWSQPVTAPMQSDCVAQIAGDARLFTALQSVVDAATAGDTIKLAGVCRGMNVAQVPDYFIYDIALRQVAYIDKTLTIEGGHNPDDMNEEPDMEVYPTQIDAQRQGRGLAMFSGGHEYSANVTLRNLHIINGDGNNLRGSTENGDAGGGLYAAFVLLTVDNVTISDSDASSTTNNGNGGGFYIYESHVSLSNLTTRDNVASRSGGGGLISASDGHIRDSHFIDNTADYLGGGLSVRYSNEMHVRDNVFRGNRAESLANGQGGGMMSLYHASSHVERNRFFGNGAGYAGGGYGVGCFNDVYSIPSAIRNNVVANNYLLGSTNSGSGIFAARTDNWLQHNTIANNLYGAGLSVSRVMPRTECIEYRPTVISAENNIITGHTVGIATNNATVNARGTLWWQNDVNYGSGVTDSDGVTGDPLFRDVANDDYHLNVLQSAAINAGVSLPLVLDDMDGQPRNEDNQGYDIGADEYAALEFSHRLMFYFAADNNLSETLEIVVAELQQIVSPDIAVLVLYDGGTQHDSELVQILSDGKIQYMPVWMSSEINTGDEKNLTEFVNWGATYFPAAYTYLTIGGHGGGVNGVAPDWDVNDYLTPRELVDSIADWQEGVDILHFDSCSMGMAEVAYAFRDKADYMIAASSLAWGVFAYTDYYAAGFTQRTPLEQAIQIADRYHSHAGLDNRSRNIAVYDLQEMDGLKTVVAGLSDALMGGDFSAELTQVISQVQRFDSEIYYTVDGDDEFIDLYHFAELVEQEVDDATVDAAAQAVRQQLTGVVRSAPPLIKRAHQTSALIDWDLSHSHGIGIFYPSSSTSLGYGRYGVANWTFSAASNWADLLTTYHGTPPPLSLGGGNTIPFGETLPPDQNVPTAVGLGEVSAEQLTLPLLTLFALLITTTFVLHRRS